MNQPKEEQLDLEMEEQQEEAQDVEIPVQDEAENAETTIIQEAEPAQDRLKKLKTKLKSVLTGLLKKCGITKKTQRKPLNSHNKKKKKPRAKRTFNKMDTSYLSEYTGRVDSQMAQAEATLKSAMELGDTKLRLLLKSKLVN